MFFNLDFSTHHRSSVQRQQPYLRRLRRGRVVGDSQPMDGRLGQSLSGHVRLRTLCARPGRRVGSAQTTYNRPLLTGFTSTAISTVEQLAEDEGSRLLTIIGQTRRINRGIVQR